MELSLVELLVQHLFEPTLTVLLFQRLYTTEQARVLNKDFLTKTIELAHDEFITLFVYLLLHFVQVVEKLLLTVKHGILTRLFLHQLPQILDLLLHGLPLVHQVVYLLTQGLLHLVDGLIDLV